MHVLRVMALSFCGLLMTKLLYASVFENAARAVWVNEAIVATFTYDNAHLMAQQKEIAHYFTANGWLSYSKAQQDANLLESVKKNAYYVSAVALMPPEIKSLGHQKWQAVMPIRVVYKNPQYQQQQTLGITLNFIETSISEGVRGFAIEDLKAHVISPPCQCETASNVLTRAWA